MPLTPNISAYEDCFELWDRAVMDGTGARARLSDKIQAGLYRMRMQKARMLMRDETRRQFSLSDPQHGKTAYDRFKVTVKEDIEGRWWVYVTLQGQEIDIIEGLSEDAA